MRIYVCHEKITKMLLLFVIKLNLKGEVKIKSGPPLFFFFHSFFLLWPIYLIIQLVKLVT